MKCLVCGFEGKFEDQEVVVDFDINSFNEYDNDEGREVISTRKNIKTVEQQVCPNCRIVYQFNVC